MGDSEEERNARESPDGLAWRKAEVPCPECGAEELYCRLEDRGGEVEEDGHHRCRACGLSYWVEDHDVI